MPPSEDEASLDDDEFVMPEDPVEQEHFKPRLMATANSLKKKQQQLRADQDRLVDRWTEVLAAEEHELKRPSKSYPKCKLLPRLEEEAYELASPADNTADRPPRGPASLEKYKATGEHARLARYVGRQGKANKIDLRIAWVPHDT